MATPSSPPRPARTPTPDWYHNVVASPGTEVEVGTGTIRVRARVATGEERDRIWSRQKQGLSAVRGVRVQDIAGHPGHRARTRLSASAAPVAGGQATRIGPIWQTRSGEHRAEDSAAVPRRGIRPRPVPRLLRRPSRRVGPLRERGRILRLPPGDRPADRLLPPHQGAARSCLPALGRGRRGDGALLPAHGGVDGCGGGRDPLRAVHVAEHLRPGPGVPVDVAGRGRDRRIHAGPRGQCRGVETAGGHRDCP